jgi:hypothetical protein
MLFIMREMQGSFWFSREEKREKREDHHPEGALCYRLSRRIRRGRAFQAIESRGIEGGIAKAVLFSWLWEDAY